MIAWHGEAKRAACQWRIVRFGQMTRSCRGGRENAQAAADAAARDLMLKAWFSRR
jgi:hypothetical protein